MKVFLAHSLFTADGTSGGAESNRGGFISDVQKDSSVSGQGKVCDGNYHKMKGRENLSKGTLPQWNTK